VSIWGDPHPKILKVTIDGNQATVVDDDAALSEGQSVWLRREGGRWLVDGDGYPV
jgi:hypothetical protein